MLALLVPAAIVLAAPQETVLAPDSEARWMPFELTIGNQIRFKMQAGGHTVHAVLDTGISHTLVSRSLADTLHLKQRGGQNATAIGGTVAIRWADAPRLAFGGLSRSGGRVAVTDLPDLPGGAPDLFIGADLLACCALDIDYTARRFRLLPSGRMPFTGDAAPLARQSGTGAFVTEIASGGHRLRPVLVDTGDGSSVTMTSQSWTAVRPPEARTTTTIGYGVGGPVVDGFAILSSLALGRHVTAPVTVRIEPGGGYSQSVGAAGRIGTELLMRYRVLLDPRAGRMILLSDPQAKLPPLRSTSGFQFNYAEGALKILHVMRGSPAEAGGWKAGERICAADGVSVRDDVEADGITDWSIAAPGRIVRLKDCDGRERPITLANFY